MFEILDQLTANLLDGEIDEAQRKRLNELLRDEACRRRYVDQVKMHYSLSCRSGATNPTTNPAALSQLTVNARLARAVHFEPEPSEKADDALRRSVLGDWRYASIAAAAAVLVLGGLAVIAQRSSTLVESTVAGAESASGEVPRRNDALGSDDGAVGETFAARIVSMSSDANWDLDGGVADFLLRLRVGERLKLKQGVVKLEFASDATAVLFAPAHIEVSGRGEVLLIDGRLTGRSEEGDLVVKTRSARVVDIGTAFGVVVKASETNVVVFEGEVDVHRDPERQQPVRITAGMSIRADQSGLDVPQRSDNSPWLDRDFQGQRPGALGASELSLVDIVCGSAPGEYRNAGSIDPNTGTWTVLPWSDQKGVRVAPATGLVSQVASNPWVHGVFVPSPNDSAITVDLNDGQINPPEFSGGAWGPIWARRPFDSQADPLMASEGQNTEGFWGAGTKQALLDRSRWVRDGIVGFHANVGITIDLEAIRTRLGAAPKVFRGVLAHLEKSHVSLPFHPEAKTSFQVFVDGERRYERLNFCRKDGDTMFGAELKEGDRLLTLLATDGGDGPIYDRLVLLDPVIQLAAPMTP